MFRLAFVAAVMLASLIVCVDHAAAQRTSSKPQLVTKYGDGQADGKKSIAGSGEMIRFQRPSPTQKLRGLRLHGSRYGRPRAPDEEVEISVVDEENTDVVHTEMVPYKKFKRGESRWMTILFAEPIDVPDVYWVIFDFHAEATKGVYVSFDTSTGGEHSQVGLPGGKSQEVETGGDWMIQALLTRPQ